MNWLMKLRRRRRLEQDLAEELTFHREMRAHDTDAPSFGNETRIRESMRELWSFRWIETTMRDCGYALRGFRRNPGFAITAIASMALGIGAVIAIFTAADSLLFRPLPYREPDRLTMVWESHLFRAQPESRYNVISPGNFLDWKSRNRVFEDLAVFRTNKTVFQHGARIEQLGIQSVSANLFPLLGVQVLRGRLFNAAEELASAHSDTVVVISNRLWQNWFAGDPSVIGRTVMVNSLPRTIIGVMPADFYFRDREVDLWSPLGLDPATPYRKTHGRYLMALGRLKKDVSIDQAQAQMTDIAKSLEQTEPVFDKNWTVTLQPLRDSLVGQVRSSLLLLLGAVGLLLAVACTNVANLLLARYSSRRPEMAVRIALGAGRARLIRQLLTESLLLAIIAGALGILVGRYALDGLLALAPADLAKTAHIVVDWRIILFAVGLSAVTGILFGLVPSLFAANDAAPGIKQSARAGSVHGAGTRALLIAGEVAVSVILLTGAGLLFRSLVKLQGVDSGMNPAGILTFRFSAPAARYPTASSRTQLYARALERIQNLPGVRAASAVSYLPFDGIAAGTSVAFAGRPPAKPGEALVASIRTVMPRYFETTGIPLRRGRDFTAVDDISQSPMRFIVNEAFAHQYMRGEEPLGKAISVAMDTTNPFGEVIGVVGDVREGSLGRPAVPTVYYVHSHFAYTSMILLARTSRDPLSLVTPVRAILHDLDPASPMADVRTMVSVLGETYARERFSTLLLIGFSLSALLLAAIGIYGVLAYSVSERTREIGVRLAIGADARRIAGMVLGDGARFVLGGLAVGIAGAFAISRLMEALLFGIGPRDLASFTVAPGILLAVALGAAYIPARRASKLDPIQALRVE